MSSMELNIHAGEPAAVVGDVGGTNARFAIADLSAPLKPRLQDLRTFESKNFSSLNAAVAAYLARVAPTRTPPVAVIAVAGPVAHGEATLTNLTWHASDAALRALGFAHAQLINDFRALAVATDILGAADLVQLGPYLPRPANETLAIVGAGTGFGVSAVVREGRDRLIVASEGGHTTFAPESEREIEIFRILAQRFGHVSVERIISGPGLVNLYEALCKIMGGTARASTPSQVLGEAEHMPGVARDAVTQFCATFGAVAGDIALTFGARGGMLIAGSLAQRMLFFLQQGDFRARFESKGRLSHLVRAIPTHLVSHDNAALLGCARLAQQQLYDGAPG